MGNHSYRYKGSQENIMIAARYKDTTKLRTCLRCSQVFMSLYNGNRICDKHGKNRDVNNEPVYMPDSWGNNIAIETIGLIDCSKSSNKRKGERNDNE